MIRLVWSGIDTWEESFQGELEQDTLDALAEKKGRSQDSDSPVVWHLGGRKFYVQPHGVRPWRYLLKSEDMQLRLCSSSDAPSLSGRLRPLGLVSEGAGQLQAELSRLGEGLGLEPVGVSRVDLALDFQGWTPTVADMEHAVCLASYRPIYPNLEHPETFRFGKGDVVVRLYNKSREIVKSRKEWMREVWVQSADYRPEQDVWRFEVQLRGPALRRLGGRSSQWVLDNLPGLLGFGLDWCQLRVPEGKNQSRWPEDSRWTELRRGSFAGEPLKRIKAAHYHAGYMRSSKMIFGYTLSAAAWMGIYDFETIWGLLRKSMLGYIERKEEKFHKDFSALVKERELKAGNGI